MVENFKVRYGLWGIGMKGELLAIIKEPEMKLFITISLVVPLQK
jgi:hypothetical protein